jgi:hypothetical protein
VIQFIPEAAMSEYIQNAVNSLSQEVPYTHTAAFIVLQLVTGSVIVVTLLQIYSSLSYFAIDFIACIP